MGRGFKAAAGLLLAAGFASIPLTTAATGTAGFDRRDCRAVTSLQDARLGFEVRCDFEPSQLAIDPDHRVLSTRRQASITGGDPGGDPGQQMGCRRNHEGRSIRCLGRAENGATIAGRFRVAGDPCATATDFTVTGGVDCDGGEACIEVALIDERADRRPSGC
jgi:hypothetical protein